MIKELTSPWADTFDTLVKQASNCLVICSPFIGKAPCARVIKLLRESERLGISLLLLTDLSRENMLSGVTDVAGLVQLCDALPRADIRFLPRVHAKVYIADECSAVVSSGNLTDNGLFRNFEYGIRINDESLVRKIRMDILAYRSLGSAIDRSQLRVFERIISELREIRVKAERSLKAQLRKEFDAKLREADNEILRVRAEGLSAHGAFADTILFILTKAPKDTKEIYAEIRAIHPDLCDDAVKLVIRGEAWSQANWHHKVRHAQLFLTRQGKIVRRGTKWHLVR
jgi:phosphatidylserine/phosphatidylglycerophosphate/cardiolipin synthase-like enzyme